MQMRYVFPRTPELKDLTLDVENREGDILFEVAGPEKDFYHSIFDCTFLLHIHPYLQW